MLPNWIENGQKKVYREQTVDKYFFPVQNSYR